MSFFPKSWVDLLPGWVQKTLIILYLPIFLIDIREAIKENDLLKILIRNKAAKLLYIYYLKTLKFFYSKFYL